MISFSALIVDGYIQFFTGVNIVGFTRAGDRISSFFGDELIMGSYLSRLFSLLFALFIVKEKKKLELYFMGLLFILLSGLILISGERAAIFFYVLSFTFIIIFMKGYTKLRIVLSVCCLILMIIIISILAVLVVILGYTTWNLLRKNEKAEDIINNYEGYMNKFSDTLTKSEQRLKEVDSRGAFNSDDEIGFFFTTVRSLQEQLNQFRINR